MPKITGLSLLLISAGLLLQCSLDYEKVLSPFKTTASPKGNIRIEMEHGHFYGKGFTGTYEFDRSEYSEAVDESYGYFGEIRILQLNKYQVIMQLELCKGPAFNLAAFSETLILEDSTLTYRDDLIGPCEIIFKFEQDRIYVKENSNSNLDCGFGHGVIVHGNFNKISRDFKTQGSN